MQSRLAKQANAAQKENGTQKAKEKKTKKQKSVESVCLKSSSEALYNKAKRDFLKVSKKKTQSHFVLF